MNGNGNTEYPIDDDNITLEKYRHMYSLSKEVFAEEIERATRIDNKASLYLTVITFLLGGYAFFSDHVLSQCLPPSTTFDWIYIIVAGLTLLSLMFAWWFTFRVLHIRVYSKIPLDIPFFETNRLVDVFHAFARGIKQHLEMNRAQTDIKSSRLRTSYGLITTSVALLIILAVLFTIQSWDNESANQQSIGVEQNER